MNGVRLTASPIRQLLALGRRPGMISLAGGLPEASLFPSTDLAAAASAVLTAGDCLQYGPSEGLPDLREWIAQRLRRRGVAATADRVFITNGSQHALTIALAALAGPGTAIGLETPAYPGARQAAELTGATVLDIALADGRTPDLAHLAWLQRERGLSVLVTTPTARNPTGVTLDRTEREALVGTAADLGLMLVEDDPYADLWFSDPPPPPLASLTGRAILCGSFSKILAPGLRLGWLHVPAEFADAVAVLLQATCLHANHVAQHIVWRWLQTADLDGLLDRTRTLYRERCDGMTQALAELLPTWRPGPPPAGGMFHWVRLPAGHAATPFATRAIAQQVLVVPGGAFFASGTPDDHVRLSFVSNPPAVMREGLARLARAWRRSPRAEEAAGTR